MIRGLFYSVCLTLMVILNVSCSGEIRRYQIDGYAQGTTYKVIYYATKEVVSKGEIDSIFAEFNSSCSLYDTNSLISKINRGETDSVDIHIAKCEEVARQLYEASDGAFDITVYPLSRAYGFLKDKKKDSINLDSIMPLIGHDKIRIEDGRIVRAVEGVNINLNSLAQGYSVDLVSNFLIKKSLSSFLVELGGEIYCRGKKPDGELWRVGVDSPNDGNIAPGEDLALIVTLTDKAINTSGNYRNFYKEGDTRFNHIIDPRTGKSSVNDMLSATVVAKSGMLSDGIATMLMVLGSDKSIEFLSKRDDIEGYIIYQKNGEIKNFSTLKKP